MVDYGRECSSYALVTGVSKLIGLELGVVFNISFTPEY